ncbi:hypothetical protein AB0J52_04175 [Spirillospora sp. NPDC049652]
MASSLVQPSRGAILRERYRSRLPGSLDELSGPTHGEVQLPLQIAWSGLTKFDLSLPRQRMSMYCTVLAEGRRDDIAEFLNKELLLAQWPVLRTLVSRAIRDVWEARFAALATA